METNEEKLERLEFYQELLLPVTKASFPFYALIVKNKLTKHEVNEIFDLCQQLENQYEKQKEEGFVTFAPLLTHFVGMLNYKLDPHKTIVALYEQDFYRGLMNEFLKNNKHN